MSKTKIYTQDDLMCAFECAADFLEAEEWPNPEDMVAQSAANKEAARRIRAIVTRMIKKEAKIER